MVNENSSLKNLNVLNAMFGIPSKAEFILDQFYGDLGSTNNFRTILSLRLHIDRASPIRKPTMVCDFYHASHQGSKYKQGYHLWSSFFDNHDQTFVTHSTLISFNSQVGWLAENDILHSAFITIVWINADCDCLTYLLFYDNNIIMKKTLKIRIHTTEKRKVQWHLS